jgi:hypothetical protein
MSEFKLIDSYTNNGEIIISQEKELLNVLNTAINSGNKIFILDSMGFGSLTLGVGKPYGFIEFIKENGETPYLITCNKNLNAEDGSYIEFDSGGTPTPIPLRNCLPISTIIEIVIFFFVNKTLPKNVIWGEE